MKREEKDEETNRNKSQTGKTILNEQNKEKETVENVLIGIDIGN